MLGSAVNCLTDIVAFAPKLVINCYQNPLYMTMIMCYTQGSLGSRLALSEAKVRLAMEHKVKVYGAWRYKGVWDGHTPPPLDDWELVRVVPGRFQDCPLGMEPMAGEVTLLMQGDSVLVVTPDAGG